MNYSTARLWRRPQTQFASQQQQQSAKIPPPCWPEMSGVDGRYGVDSNSIGGEKFNALRDQSAMPELKPIDERSKVAKNTI
jgi:hypothetical protein